MFSKAHSKALQKTVERFYDNLSNLSERREAKGVSQGDLAQAVGVTRQTINAIERNRYDPSLELAFAMAEHFECAIEDIFDPVKIDP